MTTASAFADGNAAEQRIYLAHPKAIDGHTLRDDSGNEYKLHAVRAPRLKQTCLTADGTGYDCGERARLALETYASSLLTCMQSSDQSADRSIRCRDFLGRDLGALMVSNGWALPDRRVSQRYIFEEMEASAQRLGLWQGRFTVRR